MWSVSWDTMWSVNGTLCGVLVGVSGLGSTGSICARYYRYPSVLRSSTRC